jgi:hypothetical protein
VISNGATGPTGPTGAQGGAGPAGLEGTISLTLDSRFNLAVGTNNLIYASGFDNIAIGNLALRGSSLGGTGIQSHSIAIGEQALSGGIPTTGPDSPSIVIGDRQGPININPVGSISIGGNGTGHGGDRSIVIGKDAAADGGNDTTGDNDSIYIGACAGGARNSICNIGIGFSASYNLVGDGNISIGTVGQGNSNSMCNNIVMGPSALGNAASGGVVRNNIALGVNNLKDLSIGCGNIAIGSNVSRNLITGYCNTAVGDASLISLQNGAFNTALGFRAGNLIALGENNTFIGANAGGGNGGAFDRRAYIGSSEVTNIVSYALSQTSLSDRRDKTQIENLPIGLDFLNDIRPVKFTWNTRDRSRIDVKDSGFIAQELAEVVEKYQASSWLHLVNSEESENLKVAMDRLIPIIVKSIQELADRDDIELEELTIELENLKKQLGEQSSINS